MKTIILILTSILVLAQEELKVEPTLIPALKPVPLGWKHPREDDSVFYVLKQGTNELKVFQTNEFTVKAIVDAIVTNADGSTTTNKMSQIEVVYAPGFERGTNDVTVVARVPVEGIPDSDPSNVLPLKALGKPAAPSGLRKP